MNVEKIDDAIAHGLILLMCGLGAVGTFVILRDQYVFRQENDPDLLSASRPAPALPAKSNPALPRIQIPAPK
jgi:hypothetical protein